MDEITPPVAAIRPPVETPLRQVMQEQGRQQKWLAEKLGVSASEVSDYCRGIHVPRASTRAAIARALGKPENHLWPEERAA